MHLNKAHPWRLTILIVVLTGGCDRRDERLTQLAQQSVELQAAQNQEMSELNREVASGTRHLIEANATSSDKLLAMQSDLQRQHDQLEDERRSWARDRTRESLLVPVLTSLGAGLLALVPLLICWRMLARLGGESAETELDGFLIEQLLESIPSQTALPGSPPDPPALPGPASVAAAPCSNNTGT